LADSPAPLKNNASAAEANPEEHPQPCPRVDVPTITLTVECDLLQFNTRLLMCSVGWSDKKWLQKFPERHLVDAYQAAGMIFHDNTLTNKHHRWRLADKSTTTAIKGTVN
jgi:hypothetical protein